MTPNFGRIKVDKPMSSYSLLVTNIYECLLGAFVLRRPIQNWTRSDSQCSCSSTANTGHLEPLQIKFSLGPRQESHASKRSLPHTIYLRLDAVKFLLPTLLIIALFDRQSLLNQVIAPCVPIAASVLASVPTSVLVPVTTSVPVSVPLAFASP